MRPSPLKRIFAGAALFAACFAASSVTAVSDARAQTTTTGPTVTVSGLVSRDGPPHNPNIGLNVINYADCVANETIHIPLTITGIATGNTLEAWAGEGTVDCTNVTNRSTATAQCWQVKSGINGSVQTTSADLSAWDIVSQFGAATKVPVGQAGTADSCNSPTISAGPHTITISFFFTNGTNGVGTGATYTITAAMQAAPINGSLTLPDPGAGAGDGLIKVKLPDSPDPSIQSYQFYCDPPPSAGGDANASAVDADPNTQRAPDSSLVAPSCSGTTGTVDSGTTADGGDDASDGGDSGDAADASDSGDSSTSGAVADASTADCGGLPLNVTPSDEAGAASTCTSSVLIPGSTVNSEGGVTGTVIRPPPPEAYKCQSSGATTSEVTIGGLTNGVRYRIAAAASDIYGNVGPLTPLICATPQPVDDFWNVYGGPAGGGFCALEGAGMPAGMAVFAGAMLMAAIGLMRRRRRS